MHIYYSFFLVWYRFQLFLLPPIVVSELFVPSKILAGLSGFSNGWSLYPSKFFKIYMNFSSDLLSNFLMGSSEKNGEKWFLNIFYHFWKLFPISRYPLLIFVAHKRIYGGYFSFFFFLFLLTFLKQEIHKADTTQHTKWVSS